VDQAAIPASFIYNRPDKGGSAQLRPPATPRVHGRDPSMFTFYNYDSAKSDPMPAEGPF